MYYPITFSIPESKIITTIPIKTKTVSNIIPGQLQTYIYSNEADYYNEYQQSMFAITTKKAGWDCMRHYEIIANGCIPYFPNIELCPVMTMALLPKDLILEGNQLYKKYKDTSINDFKQHETLECNILIEKLLNYIKTNLTTKQLAKYILEKTNFTHISKILYLSQSTSPDYLRCVTLHGFKELFGSNCHDYPKIPHIYKTTNINYSNLYGKGITYSNLLNEKLHDNLLDNTIEQDIIDKKYDIIIYGSYHRGMPYYDLIKNVYNPNEIIMLCGEDEHLCSYIHFVNSGHNLFIRELM
jgi:hypothetical protein